LQELTGGTALIQAAWEKQLDTVRLLLDRGAAPNLRGAKGWTALAIASRLGETETVRLLLERGADPYMRNAQSETALDIAINPSLLLSE
jgi:ankyrin repeat protein